MSNQDSIEEKNIAFDFKVAESTGTFEGYAAIFNTEDQGGDIIEPQAFTKSLEQRGTNIKMLWQHDPSQPIGVWDSFAPDSTGLHARGTILSDVQKGAEALALMRAKALDGLSIGYRTVAREYEESKDGTIRRLKELDLLEVSVVTFPMHTDALVTDVKQLQHVGDVERILRKAGVANTCAKLIASHGFNEAMKRLNDDHRDDDVDEARARVEDLLTKLQGLKEIINA